MLRPILVALALLVALPAAADKKKRKAPEAPPPAKVEPPKPWAEGVPAEAQAAAIALFDEGNRFFAESQYTLALEKYRLALASWDHPAIHFNVTVCLINLDQPLEAHAHLEKALRFGAAPLGDDHHKDALTYQKLLNGRLARLRIECDQEGVRVSLDGKQVVDCPGSDERLVMPGPHQVVGRHPSLVPATHDLVLVGGTRHVEKLHLVPLSSATTMQRRFATWVPWAVAGAGVAMAGIGFGFRSLSQSDYDQYDREISLMCPQGCRADEIPAATSDLKSRARLEAGLAVGAFALGGAAIATGIVLLVMNQPRPVLLPEASPRGAGVSLVMPF